MARSTAILSTLALLLAAVPARGEQASPRGSAAERARVDLSHYYAPPNEEPPYSDALDSLASPIEAHRREAGQYLLELFHQSAADEANGRSRWVQPPYWGAGPQSPARELRQTMATEF